MPHIYTLCDLLNKEQQAKAPGGWEISLSKILISTSRPALAERRRKNGYTDFWRNNNTKNIHHIIRISKPKRRQALAFYIIFIINISALRLAFIVVCRNQCFGVLRELCCSHSNGLGIFVRWKLKNEERNYLLFSWIMKFFFDGFSVFPFSLPEKVVKTVEDEVFVEKSEKREIWTKIEGFEKLIKSHSHNLMSINQVEKLFMQLKTSCFALARFFFYLCRKNPSSSRPRQYPSGKRVKWENVKNCKTKQKMLLSAPSHKGSTRWLSQLELGLTVVGKQPKWKRVICYVLGREER